MLLKHLLYLETEAPGLKKPESTYFKDIKKIPKEERPKDRWKAKSVSGTQGDVIEHRKDSTKEKRYEKTYLGYKVKDFVDELASYTVIEEINKAWKIFSGLGDMLPVPKSIIFDATTTTRDAIFNIHTSGHYKSEGTRKASTLDYDSPKANKLFEYIKYGKALFINSLIGYIDMHPGNVRINKEKSTSFYAIDFGHAFGQSRMYVTEEILDEAIRKKDKKALQRYLKQLEFFEFYLEHNKETLPNHIETVLLKYYKKFTDEAKKSNLNETELMNVAVAFRNHIDKVIKFINTTGIPDLINVYKKYKSKIEDVLK